MTREESDLSCKAGHPLTPAVWVAIIAAGLMFIGQFWYFATSQGDQARQLRDLDERARSNTSRVEDIEKHGSPQLQTLQSQINGISSRISNDETSASSSTLTNVQQGERLMRVRQELDELRAWRDVQEKEDRMRDARVIRLESIFPRRPEPP